MQEFYAVEGKTQQNGFSESFGEIKLYACKQTQVDNLQGSEEHKR